MGRFHGLWTDPTTGLNYARARWYDPRNASWLTEDPLQDYDSPNMYAFVAWQPHMATDPFGLALGDVWDPRSYADAQAWKKIGHDIWNVFSLGTLERVETQGNLGTWQGLKESAHTGLERAVNAVTIGLHDSLVEEVEESGEIGLGEVWGAVDKTVWEMTPGEQLVELAVNADRMSGGEIAVNVSIAISKTASLAAGAKATVDTVAFKRLPLPQKNLRRGNAARDSFAKKLERSGEYEVLGREVTVKIPAPKVTRSGRVKLVERRYDIAVRRPGQSKVEGIEVKSGCGSRDLYQFAADRWVNLYGARTTGAHSTAVTPRISSATTVIWPAPRMTFGPEIYGSAVISWQSNLATIPESQ